MIVCSKCKTRFESSFLFSVPLLFTPFLILPLSLTPKKRYQLKRYIKPLKVRNLAHLWVKEGAAGYQAGQGAIRDKRGRLHVVYLHVSSAILGCKPIH